ncbi:hypothetical protein [Franconibacter pulveris]|uniref:hypothetical protein n=1 Tax=Franconibacter pulveris TaxID=435910 RepID=UPI0006845368|nr:hypothetical protein [Franconibacter pulveris]
MKTFTLILLAALFPAVSATAAIEMQGPMARNMDDVHSLGVIYINHNRAGGSEADRMTINETGVVSATAHLPPAEPQIR